MPLAMRLQHALACALLLGCHGVAAPPPKGVNCAQDLGMDASLCGDNDACDRAAPPNIVVLTGVPCVGAGIEDRATIISMMATYAQALCAVIVVPAPCRLLGAHDANSSPVACSSPWAHYLDWGDSGAVVRESPDLKCGGSTDAALAIAERIMAPAPPGESGLSASKKGRRQEGALPAEGRRLGVPRVVAQPNNLSNAARLRAERTPFVLPFSISSAVWPVIVGPTCKQELARLQKGGCDRVRDNPSIFAAAAAAALLAHAGVLDSGPGGGFGGPGSGGSVLGRTTAPFMVLHLRRGDTVRFGCDNSPARVAALLECRLGKAAVEAGRPDAGPGLGGGGGSGGDRLSSNGQSQSPRRPKFPAIFFFTDEGDREYLAAVAEACARVASFVAHGDALAKEVSRAPAATHTRHREFSVFKFVLSHRACSSV